MRIYVFSYFFFFSSRRRHTRLQGDWSSDVCSSDLVICEILNPDGTMARRADLEQFAQQHGLSFITVAQLVAYRLAHERLVHRVAEARLPTPYGEFTIIGDAVHKPLVRQAIRHELGHGDRSEE